MAVNIASDCPVQASLLVFCLYGFSLLKAVLELLLEMGLELTGTPEMNIRTKDADEAAFFWVQDNMRLSGTEVKAGYRKNVLMFVFETDMTDEEFEELRNNYMNGRTRVEPKAYAAKRAEVKNLIRENIFRENNASWS